MLGHLGCKGGRGHESYNPWGQREYHVTCLQKAEVGVFLYLLKHGCSVSQVMYQRLRSEGF